MIIEIPSSSQNLTLSSLPSNFRMANDGTFLCKYFQGHRMLIPQFKQGEWRKNRILKWLQGNEEEESFIEMNLSL